MPINLYFFFFLFFCITELREYGSTAEADTMDYILRENAKISTGIKKRYSFFFKITSFKFEIVVHANYFLLPWNNEGFCWYLVDLKLFIPQMKLFIRFSIILNMYSISFPIFRTWLSVNWRGRSFRIWRNSSCYGGELKKWVNGEPECCS